jgi:hypothetical protein
MIGSPGRGRQISPERIVAPPQRPPLVADPPHEGPLLAALETDILRRAPYLDSPAGDEGAGDVRAATAAAYEILGRLVRVQALSALGDFAGAGSGMLTAGPVRDYLAELLAVPGPGKSRTRSRTDRGDS